MKNSFLLFIILGVFFTSCSEEKPCPTLSLKEGTISNQNEYDIVKAIIDTQIQKGYFFHISQGLVSFRRLETLTERIEDDQYNFSETAIDEYLSLNEKSGIWGTELYNSKQMINDDELNCHFVVERDGWIGYYEKYEDSEGVFKFSRPYIDDNNMAFIEYEITCGYECGSGYIAILKKQGEFWVVNEAINTWIS